MRNIRLFNASTHCFTTVLVILEKLPCQLRLIPSSITRDVIHVGCNDTSQQQSELTKNYFNARTRLLNDINKFIFLLLFFLISGPLPFHAAGCFSRLLSLNAWLQSTCRAFNFGFIHNFNLFWNRPSFYKTDGVHPNRLGGQMLTITPCCPTCSMRIFTCHAPSSESTPSMPITATAHNST